jgi:hypothetical protein
MTDWIRIDEGCRCADPLFGSFGGDRWISLAFADGEKSKSPVVCVLRVLGAGGGAGAIFFDRLGLTDPGL